MALLPGLHCASSQHGGLRAVRPLAWWPSALAWCSTSQGDSASEAMQCHALDILLVTNEAKAHPHSKEGELDAIVCWEDGKVVEEQME